MLKIRFQRTGRKNDPAYRIVVLEHTASPRAGKNVATVGSYHPKTKETSIDAEAVKKWMSHGAQASGTVHNLLVSKGIIEGEKVNVLSKKTPIVKEKSEDSSQESVEAPAEKGSDLPAEDSAQAETPLETETESSEGSNGEKAEEPAEEVKEEEKKEEAAEQEPKAEEEAPKEEAENKE